MTLSDMMNIGLMQGFAGLSLFAVLLLMGLGLAIIFGQMGVINMAHGEFMTIGAYSIYLAARVTESLAPAFMPYYFPIAIGLADPRALEVALNASEVYERLGTPEGELALAECVIYLAVAAKSNAVYAAYNEARAFVAADGTRPVPLHIRNAPTKLMKDLGYGKEYRYAHDESDAYAAGENYFPDGMERPSWYRPTDRGLEAKIREKLDFLRSRDAEARNNKKS